MTTELEKIVQAISALEGQRDLLGYEVVETALAPLRRQLANLQAAAPTPPPIEQRRQITVLFADLVDFTALSETSDPEEVREVLTAYFAAWTRHIETHGGLVEKFIGDAVMAVFGLHTAREDEPEHALSAALAMLGELTLLNDAYAHGFGRQLQVRIGINTGPAVISTLDERKGQEFVAVGDTVNLASRLQSAAPVNGILVSHATYQQVRGLFHVQDSYDLQVKGKTEPVRVYVVSGPVSPYSAAPQRGIEGIATPLVGRSSELNTLLDALHEVTRGNKYAAVALSSDAGLGKSRLFLEFTRRLEAISSPVTLFTARAGPSQENSPFSLFREMVALHLHIPDTAAPQDVLARLEQAFLTAHSSAGHSAGPEQGISSEDVLRRARTVAAFLGFLPGLAHPGQAASQDIRQLRDLGAHYLHDYLLALARQQPLVFLLEDLHWADDPSLDLLHQLTGQFVHEAAPILFLANTRPGLYERKPDWEVAPFYGLNLRLEPLDVDLSRRLLSEILGDVGVFPAELSASILTSAEGNPYYIEELINMLVSSGALQRTGGGWVYSADRLAGFQVPSTLTALLQARLDSLPALQRSVLQQASVFGRVFWDQAVAFVARESDQPPAVSPAEILSHCPVIDRQPESTFASSNQYIFHHILFRDVTYSSLLKRLRRIYHRSAAQWLEQSTIRQRADEFAAQIAAHYEYAAEHDLAADWYLRAGRRALGQFAAPEAKRLIESSLRLANSQNLNLLVKIHEAFNQAHDFLADRKAQRDELLLLEDYATRSADPTLQAVAYNAWSRYYETIGEHHNTLESSRRAIELSREAGALEELTRGLLYKAAALWKISRFQEAKAPLEESLVLARQAGFSGYEADALRALGIVYEGLGDYVQAFNFVEQALKIKRELGDLRGQAACLNSLGILSISIQNFPEARNFHEQALKLRRETNDRYGMEISMHNLGVVAYCEGDYQRSREILGEVQTLAQEIDDEEGVLYALTAQMGNLINLGRYKEAIAGFQRSLEMGHEHGDPVQLNEIYAFMGLAYHYLGKHADAEAALDSAWSKAEEADTWLERFRTLFVRGRHYVDIGDLSGAEDIYRRALALPNIEGTNSKMDILAGLVEALMAQGEVANAAEAAMKIYIHLYAGAEIQRQVMGCYDPMRVFLACHNALKSAGEIEKAQKVLRDGCRMLTDYAGRISDPALRSSFLENVVLHRQLRSLCEAVTKP